MTVGHSQEPTDRSPGETGAPKARDGSTTLQVLDDDALAELLELDRLSRGNVFERVVKIYLDEAPVILGRLRSAVDDGEPERVSTAAHSLKSSSLNVGAKTLSALCKELEALGRSGRTDGAIHLLDQIEALYPAVVAALQERTRRSSGEE